MTENRAEICRDHEICRDSGVIIYYTDCLNLRCILIKYLQCAALNIYKHIFLSPDV
ncbi:hypothetical protein BKA69DRAFT_1070937, partial [Paraphysoderma sedebokerense]